MVLPAFQTRDASAGSELVFGAGRHLASAAASC